MAILNFPNTRQNGDPLEAGDSYTGDNGVTYTYDGLKWIGRNVAISPNSNAIVNGGYVVQVDTGGNLFTPSYVFPNLPGEQGQVLTWPASGTILEWTDQTGSGGATNTRWDATATEPNGCPMFVELNSDHYYAYTQRSHIRLENNGYWDIGSTILGNGVEGYFDGNLSVFSTGTVKIRSGYSQNEWTFGTDGKLTLPNGATIGSDNSLLGIPLTTDRGTILFGNHPEQCIPPTSSNHFHIMRDDPTNVDLFFGDDFDYVKLPNVYSGSGVEIGTNGSNTWRFGTDTILTIPGDIQDANGSVIRIATTSTAPTRVEGQLWFNTEDGRAYIRYDNTWLDLNPTEVPAPSTYLDGLTIDGTTLGTVDSTASIYVSGDLIPELDKEYDLGSADRQWKSLYVSTSTIYIGGTALSVDAGGNLLVDGSPIAASGGDRLVSGNNSAILDETGTLTLPGDIIAQDGRFIQNCDNGTSSMRWVNATTTGPEDDIEMGRAYRDGGAPYVSQNENNERVQYGFRDIDTSTSAFYIMATKNPLGMFENPADDSRWEFQGDGLLTLPSGNSKIGSFYGTDAILASTGTAFGIVSQGTGSSILQWINDVNDPTTIAGIAINSPYSSTGSVQIYTGGVGPTPQNAWTFSQDGNTTFPNGAKLNNGTANQFATDNTVTTSLDLRDASGRGFYTNSDGFSLRGNSSNTWQFGNDGKLTLPGLLTLPVTTSTPAVTTATGTVAVCDGIGWDGGADGLQHLMIYINNTWTKVV